MGVLFHGVERSELAEGDHIYTYRSVYTYAHHGIYVGGERVVHFTDEQNIVSGGATRSFGSTYLPASSINVSSTCIMPDCGFHKERCGVVLSCLNCFLGNGGLYRFDYGVPTSVFLIKLRGGTCTKAKADPPVEVIHRATYLLYNGFGKYNVLENNCEDFALYCKTGLRASGKKSQGQSGQVASVLGAPTAALLSFSIKLFTSNPTSAVVATTGIYWLNRYARDLGVRSDVTKVKMEDVTDDWKGSKKSINESHCSKDGVTLARSLKIGQNEIS